MNTGTALMIFSDIRNDKYTISEKALAIRKVLDMPTHNGMTKDKILGALDWVWCERFEVVYEYRPSEIAMEEEDDAQNQTED